MTQTKLHPQIGQIEVSVYTNGFDAKSRRYFRLQEIIDIIITGRPLIFNPTRPIKDLQIEGRYKKAEASHDEYQNWKRDNLPMFLVTGCFSERKTNALVGPHTSLINVDIDHIENVQDLKNQLIQNEPSLVIAGISPGGDGIKLIFHVAPTPTDAAEHRVIAAQLHKYLSEKYKIPIIHKASETGIDTGGTRLTFTCFFFHDPDLFVNPNIPNSFQASLTKTDTPIDVTDMGSFDWHKLDHVLRFFTPDCSYEDWITIGMALKYEGTKRNQEDIFFSKWDEWSRESSTKYNASEMEDKWTSFNQENTDQVTLGSIYTTAKQAGWIAPYTEISSKTNQNRKTREQIELEEYAQEQQLPIYLRPYPSEDTDIARLLQYYKNNFLIVSNKDIYILTTQGSWDKIEVERANGFLDNIIHNARELALTEAEEHPFGGIEYKIRLSKSFKSTNSHIKALTGRLLKLASITDTGIDSIKTQDFNNRIKHNPTLPLQYGAIDLTDGKVLTPLEYASYHALATEYWAAEYNPDILTKDSEDCRIAKHLIEEHYGKELISRLAYHLIYQNKSVDIINIPTSSAGKTALVEWLKLALGNVGLDSRSRSLLPKGDAYTQATAPLTEHLLYFFDEVDKLPEDISPGTINEMTSEELTISKKFQNPTYLARTGTPIMIGADWPPIDTTAQGLDTRITYVYYNEIPPMPEATKKILQHSTDAHEYLLAYIIKECINWHNNPHGWIESPAAKIARERFFKERTPEAKQILMDTYSASSNPNDCITVDHVKETLVGILENRQQIHKTVTSVFPKTKKVRKRVEEQNTYVYSYLQLKIADTLDQPAMKDIEEALLGL